MAFASTIVCERLPSFVALFSAPNARKSTKKPLKQVLLRPGQAKVLE
jgi:hypothetical protein